MTGRNVALALAASLIATGADAATIVGVDDASNLVTFDSAAPGTVLRSVAITGLGAGAALNALDFRPINNLLYGLGSDRVIYSINAGTGVATALGAPLALTGTNFAFDFNPTIDRLRIVSDTNQNYVYNPNDGSLTLATPVAYATGDANAGREPDVTAAAYTNSVFGAAAGTTQLYSIDTNLDVLTTQANSAGTLATRGPLGVDLDGRTSFDIAGNDAFVQNGRSFYSVNLGTGALTRIGTNDRTLLGIAIAVVPEPATWGMMILGFGVAGVALRRRTRTSIRFA